MKLSLDGNNWKLVYLMPHEWESRKVWEADFHPAAGFPAATGWLQGTVPGDVISDSLDAGLIPQPYVDMNSRSCEWLSQRDWVYRRDLTVPEEWKGRNITLNFGGVDCSCRVYLNGQFLGTHEGMFLPFRYDVTSHLRWDASNHLVVIVMHAPPVDIVQGQVGHTSDARTWKARFAYNWDWCTRLIPVGIWQSVELQATGPIRIENLWILPQVEGDSARVRIAITTSVLTNALTESTVNVHLSDPDGRKVISQTVPVSSTGLTELVLDVPSPRLWWPLELGEQPLYTVHASVHDKEGSVSDEASSTCGLRSIRLIANEGPTADALPYTVEVNGQRLFAKAWNWVPIDHMYGRVQKDRYEHLIETARHAHCNLLRVWGGGLLERKEFYDICDRKGILVWQEFFQSSSGVDNRPPTDPEYLSYIEDQARQLVPQRRNHPSLTIWCGGNELMSDDYKPLDSAHPALAVLKKVVDELDPDRAWLPTSASGPVHHVDVKEAGTGRMHDVHGPWKYGGEVDHYQMFNTVDPLFHSEFGTEGAANLRTLKRFISPELLWPPDATNPAWVHHGSWWLHREQLEKLFGAIDNIEDFVRCSQLMHAEGLRYQVESNRRRQWKCSGVCPWQLNEAFPNAACTNVVDYLGDTKPAYWWVRRAYEPLHVSMKYDKLKWATGESMTGEIWVNNSHGARPGLKWDAHVVDLHGKLLATAGAVFIAPDNAGTQLGKIEHRFEEPGEAIAIFIRITDPDGQVLSRNEYFFSTADHVLEPLRSAPEATLDIRRGLKAVTVHNTGQVPALLIQVFSEDAWRLPSDDYFSLLAGEQLILHDVPDDAQFRGWNCSG